MVVSQPDRPFGRGRKATPNPIAQFAKDKDATSTTEKPDEAFKQWVIEESMNLVIVIAYGHILRKSLLEIPRCGFVNLHASLLPKCEVHHPFNLRLIQEKHALV